MSTPATLQEALTEIDRLNKLVGVLRECLGEAASPASVSSADRLVDHEESARILRELVNGTDPAKGEEFFSSLVRHLASALKTKYAVVWGFSDGRRDRMKTLAVWAGDKVGENFEVPIAGSPCAWTVEHRGYSAFPEGVRAQFPGIGLLDVLGVESYFAAPMFGSNGQVSGNLVVMHDVPRDLTSEERSILELFAARAGAELGRQEAEQALKRSEAHFRALIEQASDVVAVFSVDGTVRYQSPSLERTMGYRPEERLGRSAFEQMHPDDVPLAQALIGEALEHRGEIRSGEFRLRHRDGSWRTLEIVGRAARDAEGVLCVIANMRDITERKQADEAIRRQRQDLLVAQTLANLGSWKWNIDTGEVVWSDEQYRIFGHEPGSMRPTYEAFFSALLPDDHDRVLAALNDALAGTAPYNMEFRIVRPSGEIRTVHVRGTVIRDTAGHPVGMEGTVLDVTERKQMEEALRASEERWQLAARGSNDAIWDWDIRSGEVFFSGRWRAMRSDEDQETTGSLDDWRSRIHPDDLPRVLHRLEQYLTRQCPEFCEEYRVERKDGSYMWVFDRGQALWDEQGTALRMTGSKSDITERKQAEDALRESEQRYRMLVDLSPSGIFVYCEGKTVYVNRAACRMLGAESPEAILDRPTLDFVHPDCRGVALESARALLSGGEPVRHAELKYLKLDGTVIDVEVEAAPITWTGKPAVQGMFTDITDRKQAESVLRASEARFRSLFEHSPIAYQSLDSEGRFIDVNQRCCELLGYGCEELLGRGFDEFLADEIKDYFPRMFGAFKEDDRLRNELALRRKDGDIVDVMIEGRIQRDHDGEFVRTHCILTDITERKRAEVAVTRAHDLMKSFVEHTPAAVAMLDRELRYVAVSRRWLEDYRLGPESPIGRHHYDVFPEIKEKKEWLAIHQRCLAGAVERCDEDRFLRADGSEDWLRWEVRPWEDATGEIGGIILFTEDITERKQNEKLLAMEKAVLEMIGASDSLPNILASLCRMIEEPSGKKFCSILLLDPDGLRLHHSAAPSLPEAYVQAINGVAIGPTVGSCGTAAFTRRRIVVSDIAGDPLWTDFRDLALSYGLRACWSTPIMSSDDRVLGTFAVYYPIPKVPTEAEFIELAMATHVARIAIERKRAEEALRASEERYARATAVGKVGVWDLDVRKGEYHGDDNLKALFGYAPTELSSDPYAWLNLVHAEDQSIALAAWERILAGATDDYSYELRMIRKDGNIIWTDVRGHAIRDGRGCVVRLIGATVDVTERHRAQMELQRTKDHLQAVIQSSPLAVVTVDSDGLVTSWNPAAERTFGWSESEVRGRGVPWITGGAEEEGDRFWAQGADAAGQELTRARSDGTPLDLKMWTAPVSTDGGITTHWVGFFDDVTEFKRAQRDLERSERQLRTVLDTLPVGVWFTDAAGKVLLANPAGRRIWEGVSKVGAAHSAVSGGWWEQVGPLSGPHRWALAPVLTKGESSLNETLEIECQDGSRKTIRNSAVPVHGEDGNVLGAIVLNEDITDRIHAEQALRQQHTLLSAIMDASIDIVYVKELDGRYVHMNRAGATILGMSVDEIVGWDDAALWGPALAASCRAGDRRVIESGGTVTTEEVDIMQGGVVHYLTTKAPYRDQEGRIIGVIGVSRDITERKQAELERERRYAELHAIFGMTLALSRASTLEEIYQKALDGVEQALKCDRASVLLFDQQGVMRFVASRGLSEKFRQTVDGHSPWSRDERDPQPLLIRDTVADPSAEPYRAGLLSEGIRAAAFIPLMSPEGLLGKFTLFYHEPHEFTENEIGVARTIAGHVAYVIQRAKAEDALRLSEERFAKAFRASLHPFVIAELDTGMIVEANDAAYQLFGYTREEVEGRTTLQIGIWPSPEDRARFVELLKRQGSVRNVEVSLRMKTGMVRRCLLSSEVIVLHGRRCMVTVGNDITERRRAEEQLRQSHAFIRQVIDTDPNFIFAKDREGRFALVNKAVADAYGTTVENLIGKTDADFNPNREEVEFFRQKDLEVMDRLQDQFIPEEAITDSTGQVRWLQTVKRPILDEQGRAVMVLGASTDITERKRMEEELRRRERDLRNAIEEREQISQDLHDGILQSLYAMGLSLETCRPLLRKLRAKTIAVTLDRAVGQLNEIMSEVRAFIAGLETELWRKQDLASAIRTMVQTLAQPHGTQYRVSIDPSVGLALTPEQGMHLFSIVKEAMSNSLRHANAKHATVSLRSVKNGIRLTVSDNGVGFVPSRAAGTGHGLANMASRASRVGGTFSIHSRPKHGTRIVLELPKETAHV